MGALYEDVEKFFGDIFAYYGKLVAMFPIVFVLVPVLTCGFLSLGLLNIKYENAVDKLYAPQDSQAMEDRMHLDAIFPEDDENFYPHQIVKLGSYGCIIAAAINPTYDEDGDVAEDEYSSTEPASLDLAALQEIEILVSYIVNNISIVEAGETLHLAELCARRNGECVIDGHQQLNDSLTQCHITTLQPEVSTGTTAAHSTIRTTTETQDLCHRPRALRLCFYLKQDNSSDRHISMKWERSFLQHMGDYKDQTSSIQLFYTVSDSLDVALYEHAGRDLRLFPATVVTMMILATVLGSGGNWVSTHVLLAQLGVVATIMSIFAAFGTLSLAGIPYVDICGLMPFMVFGKYKYICVVALQEKYKSLKLWSLQKCSNMTFSYKCKMSCHLAISQKVQQQISIHWSYVIGLCLTFWNYTTCGRYRDGPHAADVGVMETDTC